MIQWTGATPETTALEAFKWQGHLFVDAKLVDDLELVSDIDPRRTTSQGSRVTPPAPEAELDSPPGMAPASPHMNGHAPS